MGARGGTRCQMVEKPFEDPPALKAPIVSSSFLHAKNLHTGRARAHSHLYIFIRGPVAHTHHDDEAPSGVDPVNESGRGVTAVACRPPLK